MRIYILFITMLLPFTVFAQEDVEYRMDIGAGVERQHIMVISTPHPPKTFSLQVPSSFVMS